MARIVLVALYDYHSLGIRGLHSWLESHDYDVSSLYFFYSTYTDRVYTPKDLRQAVDWIKAQAPDYVGIGVRSPVFPLYKSLASRLRAELPSCRLIIGGAHAAGDPAGCVPYADYVVVGEGEYALLDIVEGRVAKGVIMGREVEDLDSLPFAYYGPRAGFIGDPQRFTKLSYNTTRGCFFQCSYCQECVHPVSRRRRSPEVAASDLYKLKAQFPEIKWITFSDSVFAHDFDWIERFGKLIKPGDFYFWASGCAALLQPSMLALMKDIGFTEIRLGVQSGSQRIRTEIFNRKDSLDQILRFAWDAHALGLVTDCDFIIDNPYDTAETMKETRDYIRQLPPSTSINKFELRYWPGTVLTRRALADGVIDPEDVSGRFLRLGNWSYAYKRIVS